MHGLNKFYIANKIFREKKWLLSIAIFVTFFKAFLLRFIVVLLRQMTNENVTISPFNNLSSPFHNNRLGLWDSFSNCYFFSISSRKFEIPPKMEFLISIFACSWAFERYECCVRKGWFVIFSFIFCFFFWVSHCIP